MLNYEQQKFDEKLINKQLDITLSNNSSINYSIGDKSYSPLCDYMAECSYKCKPDVEDYKKKIGLTQTIEPSNYSYNESYLQTNNESIIKLIRDLFKDKFFSTKENIINYLNKFNNYSINHINNALNELVTNESIYITDKFNTLGKLINIDNFYIFQPILLNNDATIFERTNPIQSKPDGIPFALPDTFDIFDNNEKPILSNDAKAVKVVKPDKSTKIVQTKINFTNSDEDYLTIENIDYVKSIINELEINYNYIINVPNDDINADNKYISYGIISKLLIDDKVLNSIIVSKLAITILLDDLDFDKTILLVNYLLNNGYNLKGLTNFEKDLLIYYNSNLITTTNGKLKALVLSKKSEYKQYTLYIIKKSKLTHISGSNIILALGEPEDYDDFNEIINNEKVALSTLAKSLGFLVLSEKNKKDFITYFKIKSGSNKGARCSQAGKAHSEKIFVAIGVSNTIIQKLKKYNQVIFCNALEIYFRYYDLIKKDNKRWFFNLSQSLINDFS
jgi:hypothetical protein